MDVDTGNLLVLAIFAGSIVVVIVGYLVAWRSNRVVSRRVGSLMVAAVAGFAGVVMSAWLLGAVMPFPPPDGSSIWGPVVAVLVFSPLPLGAFYLSGKFVRRAVRENKASGHVVREDWLMATVSDNSPRAPLGRSQLAQAVLLQHTTIFLNSTGTNATATLATLQQENKFFLLTAQHVARVIEKKGEKWSYQNPALVVRHLDHPFVKTDLGSEASYSQDLTLFELHAEDAAEMVRLGLSFYDLRTSQYSSDQEYGPDYFIIGAPKSAEFIANRELNFEIRSAGVNIFEEVTVDGAPRFVEVEALEADYSGMSGGGLWEISYPASGGHRVLLVGVVVREPQQVQSTVDTFSSVGSCTIRCSSRQSIKELVERARSLAQRAGEQNS